MIKNTLKSSYYNEKSLQKPQNTVYSRLYGQNSVNTCNATIDRKLFLFTIPTY